jgi:hypothetical protein
METFLQKITQNRKYIFILVAALLGAVCAYLPEVHASFLPLPETTDLDIPTPEGDTAIEKAENLLGPAGRIIRIVIATIAVMLFVISGFIMVISGDNEETVGNQKKAVTYGVIGLLMISFAGPVAEIFDFRQGNLLESPDEFMERAQLFDDTTRVLITFVKYMLGGLAALMFVRSGATLVIGGQAEDVVTTEKKRMLTSAIGLIMVFASDLVIRRVLYNAEYNEYASETVVAINQSEFTTQIVAITNLLISFASPVLMLGIVAGGVLYVTAGGDEERTGLAKKIMKNSLIGVIIIYGAFSLVSTVIAGVF